MFNDTGAAFIDGVTHAVARHPFAGTPLDPRRKGHQERTIHMARHKLWPPDGQPPASMSKAELNAQLWGWYEERGIPEENKPSDRHVRRIFNGR